MGIGALNYQGVKGGIKLNDVIEEFKYVYQGQQIKAGDFVEYVNGIAGEVNCGTSEDTALSTSDYAGSGISAVALDDNRVFVAHNYSSSYHLYGMIVTIDGATITKGTDTALSTFGYTGETISAVLLPSGNVFIAHRYSSSSYLYGMVVTIDGTAITAGADTQLGTNSYRGLAISSCLMPNGNVFIAYEGTANGYLYGMVCSILGTGVSKGTETLIANKYKYEGSKISVCLLPNGNVFIAHSEGSSYNLNAIVCTIDGTVITAGTDTQLETTTYASFQVYARALENGNVFIVHSKTSDYYLYVMVVTINGTAITAGTDTQLGTSTCSGGTMSVVALDENKAFIAHQYGNLASGAHLYGMICTISETVVTVGTDTALNTNAYTGYRISPLLLPNGIIFAAHSYSSSYYLYAQIWGIDEANNIPTNEIVITEYEQQVTLATKPPFDGIALSSGIGGDDIGHNQQVKIARPPSAWDYQPENLLINADFNDGINNWASSISQISPTVIEENGEKILVNTATSTMTASAYTYYRGGSCQNFNQQNGEHIYYASVYYKGKTTNTSTDGVRLAMCSTSYTNEMGEASSSKQSEWKLLSMYGFFGDSSQFCLYGDVGNTATVGDQYFYKQPKLYDLTAHYGAGNEPTKEWCDENL